MGSGSGLCSSFGKPKVQVMYNAMRLSSAGSSGTVVLFFASSPASPSASPSASLSASPSVSLLQPCLTLSGSVRKRQQGVRMLGWPTWYSVRNGTRRPCLSMRCNRCPFPLGTGRHTSAAYGRCVLSHPFICTHCLSSFTPWLQLQYGRKECAALAVNSGLSVKLL